MLEEMADHLKGVLITRLFNMLDETTITFLDSKLLSAKAAIRVMAASDSLGSLGSKGSITSRRMNISWSLNIQIESIDERRAATSKMAMEWLRELVCEMENMPNPDSMRRLGQVEVGMEQLSLDKPDVSDKDVTVVKVEVHAMEVTDVLESVPDVGGEESAMDMSIMPDNVPDSVPDSSHKRRRKECSASKNNKRRVIECSEDSYYVNNEYYPTWRKYPLRK